MEKPAKVLQIHLERACIYLTFMFTDIDECQDDTNICQQGCINTDGSYNCYCWNGYELTSDEYSCQGFNS